MPAPNATPNASADRQLFADRQSVDNLAAAVQALTLKVAELEKINSNRAKAASAKAQQLKAAAVETVPLARSRSEEIELSIFAISPTGVLVSDKGKPRLVPPGDKLPGGMTFLNFDPVTRRMKTDQGEYVIPALTP
jgi:septal ring factor EnvC (AmiA/AmiB activator)